MHEHSRNDRDISITINYSNIDEDDHNQFNIHPLTDDYGPFDIWSIMMYSSSAFAKDSSINAIIDNSSTGRTWDYNIYLSQGDINGIEFLYGGPYKKLETVYIPNHPDSYYYCDGYQVEEWKDYFQNTVIFYSDQAMTNEITLTHPRRVNYTIYMTGTVGGQNVGNIVNMQLTVPSGVSRYNLDETYHQYRTVYSYVEEDFGTTVNLH